MKLTDAVPKALSKVPFVLIDPGIPKKIGTLERPLKARDLNELGSWVSVVARRYGYGLDMGP